jgi:hypothetical protein
MSVILKQLFALCIIAGMVTAAMHGSAHADRESCTQSHDHHDHHDHPSAPENCKDHDCTPHHHCSHLTVADRPSSGRLSLTAFHGSLMKISTEHSLIPDEPVFSLDKPPLI